ncbi:MAG: hypothetical protein HYV04_09080 [Deltaproteobacteria bacterium]|nr:hypothetical protein [Deltaproteobacteria bacterium]
MISQVTKTGHFSLGQRLVVLFIVVGIATVSCAYQPAPDAFDPPGFFMGLLHGFLIVFSFVGSLFTDVRIYAFPNSGWWYDFGYLIGAGMFLGSAGASS